MCRKGINIAANTFSKRYNGRRSLNLSTRGLYYNARSPTESMHIYYINFYNIYTEEILFLPNHL